MELSYKRRKFVEEFLKSWNYTHAAREAGYAVPNKSYKKILEDPLVKAAIEARLSQDAMTSREVLARLAQQARVDISDFISEGVNGKPEVNWDAVRERGYLVKSLRVTRGGVILEVHDVQKALELIGKHLALFTDNVNVSPAAIKGYVTVSPDDWDSDGSKE